MEMKEDLSGIVGAPVTPFNKDNKVDYETFSKQVDFLIRNGVSLIAHPMHIGESLNMTTEERKELAQCLAKTAAGRVPTFVHVSFGGTDQALDLAEHSVKIGATGIVMMAPYHWRPARHAMIDHFTTVAGRLDGKLIAYNNPEATGVDISPEIFSDLMDRLPNLVGLKDASFNMGYFTEVCSLVAKMGKNIAVYTGVEYLLTSVPVGGRGCFSACAEVAPKLVVSLYQACAALNIEKARPLQYKVRQLLSLLMQNYPATIKYAMELMGRPVGQTRKPILPLTSEAKAHVKETLKSLGVMDEEPRGW
jgi:dihydrodipicolinate synthase/N-acetylneuraminate lyase